MRRAAITRTAAAGLLFAASACTAAQEREPGAPEYRPLFTPAMIENAAPEQRARMRATEERNREAWEQRRAQAREREQAAAAKAAASAQKPARARNKKIYKWVDDKGGVHFGDAPSGKGAEEIEVRGAARTQGTPPPAPSLLGGGEKD